MTPPRVIPDLIRDPATAAPSSKNETNHARNRALAFALSRRCADRINDYWAVQGVAARADVADDGRIVSRLDVTKHIPRAEQRP